MNRGWAVILILLTSCGVIHPPVGADDPRVAGMVWVPAGEFIMGHDPGDGQVGVEVGVDSMPRHQVKLAGFWIGKTEVTVAEYKEFIKATGYKEFPEWAYDSGPPTPRHPVIGLSYDDAAAYCAWRGMRLPTEAEWEKAARGTDGRLYPWGNRFDPAIVMSYEPGRPGPEPVGAHPENASPYGALDMSGNVMEWTSSWYQPYPGNTLERSTFGTRRRVLKGGSWESLPPYLRAANRFSVLPVLGQPSFGVRCVLSRH